MTDRPAGEPPPRSSEVSGHPSGDPEPLAVFRAAVAALDRGDWLAVASRCDPASLRVFHLDAIHRFTLPAPVISAAELRRVHRWSEAEAAREAAAMNASLARRASDVDSEFAGVSSAEELTALAPDAAYARWLEAHTLEAQSRRFLAEHPEIGLAAVPAFEPGRIEPVGCLVRSDEAFVVYRRVTTDTRTTPAFLAEQYPDAGPDERAWLVDRVQGGTVHVLVLRRRSDGRWYLPATHWPVEGGALVRRPQGPGGT